MSKMSRTSDVDVVHIEADPGLEAPQGILLADPADEGDQGGVGAPGHLDGEVGGRLLQGGDVGRAGGLQALGGDGCDGDGHVLEGFLAPAGGDHQFFDHRNPLRGGLGGGGAWNGRHRRARQERSLQDGLHFILPNAPLCEGATSS